MPMYHLSKIGLWEFYIQLTCFKGLVYRNSYQKEIVDVERGLEDVYVGVKGLGLA